jgi:hypothetical protein
VTIRGVDRSQPRIQVTYSKNDDSFVKEADFLIVSSNSEHALSWLDATETEITLFEDRYASTIVSSLFTTESKVINLSPKGYTPKLFFGDVISDSDAAVHQGEATALLDFTPAAFNSTKKYMISYQIYQDFDVEKEGLAKSSDWRSSSLSVLESQMTPFAYSNFTVFQQEPYTYFPRLSSEQVIQGLPWDILENQGSHRTWFIGSSVSFETTENVVDYNMKLLKQFDL